MMRGCLWLDLSDVVDEGNAVSEGNHSGVHPLVGGVRAQLSQP